MSENRENAGPGVASPGNAHPSTPDVTDASRILGDAVRLAAVHGTGLTGGESSPVLDRLTRLVSRVMGVPVSLVSLVDDVSQHFPGLTGLGGWAGEERGTPLSHSFCKHVVTSGSEFVVSDAGSDERVRDNPAYHELDVIGYAGVPLTTSDGARLGALCAIDTAPRQWTPMELDTLRELALAAMSELELRRAVNALRERDVLLQEQKEELQVQSEELEQRNRELEARNLELLTVHAALDEERLQAERANSAKSDFLARMSHELRTPLNAIIGFTKQVAKNRHGGLRAQDLVFLERVAHSGEHLLGLINSILDLSKIESGKDELVIAPADVGALVRETVALLEGQPRHDGVSLLSDVPGVVTPVNTDGGKLRQVLINLAGNAIKFTRAGSVSVTLTTHGDGSPVAIVVRDTGIGISPDRLAAIFEPFEQAETTTSTEFGGTGLGLAIARSLCERLGLELSVTSEIGKGTEFRITFPGAAPGKS